MPVLNKVDPSAFSGRAPSERSKVAGEYDTLLSEYAVGDAAEVYLEEGENRQTVKSRLQSAARRKDVSLRFKRSPLHLLRFQVTEATEGENLVPAPEASANGHNHSEVAELTFA